MGSEEKKPFSLKHTIVSTFAWWYSVFLGWTTRVYWFKTEEAKLPSVGVTPHRHG